MLQLPSGQAVAEEIGVANPLTPDEIATGTDGEVAKEQGLHEATPLWYYILKEAQVREDGKRLGPVGATIVAERSEEHTSELQSLMRTTSAGFCLKKKNAIIPK